MIGRGSRSGRPRRRIVQQIGWEQYNDRTKHGLPVSDPKDPRILRTLRDNLNHMAQEKAYKKRMAQMELERLKRLERARMEFSNPAPSKTVAPLKYFSAGSDDPEKDNARKPRRRKQAAGYDGGAVNIKNKKGPR